MIHRPLDDCDNCSAFKSGWKECLKEQLENRNYNRSCDCCNSRKKILKKELISYKKPNQPKDIKTIGGLN